MSEDKEVLEPTTPEVVEPKPKASPEPEMVPKADADKLYARAKQAEEGEKKLKGELESERARAVQPTPTPPQNLENVLEEKFELRHQGYSREEIAFIKANTPQDKSMTEAAELPFVKAAIEGIRGQKKAEEATPNPSPRTLYAGDKTFRDMSPAEREKNFSGEAWRQGRKAKG